MTYLLITLPFLVYLSFLYVFNDDPDIIQGININWVYSIFRLKHHVGMFADLKYFMDYHLGGVLISLSFFLLCLFYFKKFGDRDIKIFNTLNIIIFIQQLVFIGIALIDNNGVFLKTYPFRSSALFAFLIILEVSLIAKRYWTLDLLKKLKPLIGKRTGNKSRVVFAIGMQLVLLMAFVPRFTIELSDTLKNLHVGEDKLTPEMHDLINYAKTKTGPESVFIFLDSDKPFSFIRRAQRERFVVNKFTPTNNQIIYEWYHRQLFKQKVSDDISTINELSKEYKIDYLVSERTLVQKQLTLIEEFGPYKLYRLVKL